MLCAYIPRNSARRAALRAQRKWPLEHVLMVVRCATLRSKTKRCCRRATILACWGHCQHAFQQASTPPPPPPARPGPARQQRVPDAPAQARETCAAATMPAKHARANAYNSFNGELTPPTLLLLLLLRRTACIICCSICCVRARTTHTYVWFKCLMYVRELRLLLPPPTFCVRLKTVCSTHLYPLHALSMHAAVFCCRSADDHNDDDVDDSDGGQ